MRAALVAFVAAAVASRVWAAPMPPLASAGTRHRRGNSRELPAADEGEGTTGIEAGAGFGSDPSVVTLPGIGRLQGVVDKGRGVRFFRGVPYAAPPVGDLRWRDPAKVRH